MIHHVRGEIVAKEPGRVIVEVGGLGLEVLVSESTWRTLPAPGGEARLRTHLVVREDGWTLFGFGSDDERTAFRVLLAVAGVGPRLALAVLSAVTLGELRRAVSAGDVDALVRVPGVGKKKAERLLVELKDRLALLPGSPDDAHPRVAGAAAVVERDDAVDALVALGYPRPAAIDAVRRARESGSAPDGAAVELVVKESLRRL